MRAADVARSGADAQQLCYRFIGTGQCKGPSFGCRYSNEQHSHGPDVITRHMELLLQYGHLEHANKLLECLLNDKSPMRSRLLEDWGVRLTNSFVQHLLRVFTLYPPFKEAFVGLFTFYSLQSFINFRTHSV